MNKCKYKLRIFIIFAAENENNLISNEENKSIDYVSSNDIGCL